MTAASKRVLLETVLTHPKAFGLVTASPVQRAICRIIDGVPLGDLAKREDVVRVVGGQQAIRKLREMEGVKPKEIVILAGVRGGKTLLAAANAVCASQNCDVSGLGPGDVPRLSIVAIDKDKARAAFTHLKENILAAPELRPLLVGEPTADSLMLRHPTGRPIEVMVVAGRAAGSATVSRWSAGVIFDEAPRMAGEDDGVVNLEEQARAARGRLREGAQILYPGSPWAPFGPIYEWTEERWGKPTEAMVVVRAKAQDLNPKYWTPKRVADLKEHDPDAYRVDVEAEFAMAEAAMFPEVAVKLSTRAEPMALPFDPSCEYVAAMDPATRGNAWTLVVATSSDALKRRVAIAREWVGSKASPLNPEEVLKEAAKICSAYGLTWCKTDQWAADANKAIARRYGLELIAESATVTSNVDMFTSLQARLLAGQVEFPPDPVLLADLRAVKRRTRPGTSGVQIYLPKQSNGRHCDYAPSLARALGVTLDKADVEEKESEEAKMQRQHFERRNRTEDDALVAPEDLSDVADFDA